MSGCKSKQGFTLLEVLVALVVLGLVMGGLFSEIQSQVDTRYKLQQRYLGQTAAWNRLLEQYQVIQKWTPRGETLGESTGDMQVLGRDWYWQMQVQETFGEDFYRYEVEARSKADEKSNSDGSLVAYFIAE